MATFKIKQLINGNLYRAERHGQKCIVKTFCGDESNAASLMREKRVVENLVGNPHVFVCEYKFAHAFDGRYYFGMEDAGNSMRTHYRRATSPQRASDTRSAPRAQKLFRSCSRTPSR